MAAIEIGQPAALMVCALAALFPWWLRGSAALTSPGRRRLSVGVRAALMVLLALALADMRWLRASHKSHVVWLVDVSGSVEGGAWERATNFASQVTRPESESWIAFDRAPRVVDSNASASEWGTGPSAGETDLSAALEMAGLVFPEGRTRHVVLFSDGVETVGAMEEAGATLARQGVRIHAVTVDPPDRPEVLVRGVRAPMQARLKEPFRVVAEVASNRAVETEVALFRDGVRVGAQRVALEPGTERFEWTQKIEASGSVEFTVAVTPESDGRRENNAGHVRVTAGGASRVLIVSDVPEAARAWVWALEQQGMRPEVRPPAGVPRDMGDANQFELIVLDNVAAHELSADQMELLASYVRDFGGGFLMVGGEHSFGLGGYYKTPIDDVLPVESEFRKDRETPSLGIALILDKSGSMAGEKLAMAKEAAKAAVELVTRQDYVGVVAFDSQAFWVADIQPASDAFGIAARISAIEADGGTSMGPAMELAFGQLRAVPAKVKHVILLTDGVSTPGPFYDLTSAMARDGVTVSAVGVGPDADRRLLEQVASWGNGRFYFTDSPRAIPQIFARETVIASRGALKEDPFLPQVVQVADFLGDIAWDEAPFLLGYVSTKLKPTAELWLTTERAEPLLATWRVGLGQAGAFTADARARWAAEWLPWEGFGPFWAQVMRKIARAPATELFPIELRRTGDDLRISAVAVDEAGRALDDWEVKAITRDVGGDAVQAGAPGTAEIPLKLVAPGRYEGMLPGGAKRAQEIQVIMGPPGGARMRQPASYGGGVSEEFLLRAADRDKLRRVVEMAGGRLDPMPAQVTWRDEARTAEEALELWPWFVGLAVALFLADVMLKRWPEGVPAEASA